MNIRMIIEVALFVVGIVLSLIYDSLASYWLIIFSAIITIIIEARYNVFVADVIGFYLRELIRNNNYRWYTMIGLSIIFSISAFVAGFGEPVINKEVVNPGIQIMKEASDPWSTEISKRWNGEQLINKETVRSKQAMPTNARSYHSWYHIKFAIFCWIVTFIYTFFAFWDEAKEAMHEAIKFIKEKGTGTKLHPVTVSLVDKTTGEKAIESGVSFFTQNFGKFLSLELIAEFISNFVEKVFKRLTQTA